MEWRLLFAKMRRENKSEYQIPDSELKEMIDSVMDKIHFGYYDLTNKYHLNSKTIKVGHFYPVKRLAPYQLNRPSQRYLVNSFQEIGWPDPFPFPQTVSSKSSLKEPSQSDIEKFIE
jgi:hypothetical protein